MGGREHIKKKEGKAKFVRVPSYMRETVQVRKKTEKIAFHQETKRRYAFVQTTEWIHGLKVI